MPSEPDYCEVCFDLLDEDWLYTRCEDCRRNMDYDRMFDDEEEGELGDENFTGVVQV
jgi:hypothetical protein